MLCALLFVCCLCSCVFLLCDGVLFAIKCVVMYDLFVCVFFVGYSVVLYVGCLCCCLCLCVVTDD